MRNLLLTLTLTAAAASVPAFAQDIVYEGISYTVTEGSEVTATGFAGDKNQNLVIPATFNVDGTDYTVVAIADEAFKFCNLRSASLPETLRTIGNSAFGFNMLMREINLPEGLLSVGDNAFQRCFSAPMSPKGLMYVGTDAFRECSKITEVVLAADAQVGDNAFMYCSGVKSLVLEGAPKSVGSCAFAFNSLQELTVNSVTPPAFVPEDVFCYGDNEDRDHEWTLNLADVALKVPAGAAETYKTDRNWSVFTNVSELQPDVITEFTIAPFGYKVTAEGEVTVRAFDGSETDCVIPATVEYGGQSFTVTAIADNVFANSAVEQVGISGSVKSIGENAFMNCESLAELTLEEGTETIGRYAFSKTALTAVTFPKGIKELGYGAFMHCRSLAEVTLPEGISLDMLVFFNCGLSKVTLEGKPGNLGSESMISLLLREVVFHTAEVPDFSPAEVWLISEGQFNDQVVLLVDSEEMVSRFAADPMWNVFKAILPVGSSYDAEAPYMPQNEITTIQAVEESTGLKAFVPVEDSVRMLTVFDFSFILWNGKEGLRVNDFAKSISFATWWDEFKSGDYINGYMIGMMNPETDIFTSTSHSVQNVACQDEMVPVSVTGKQLAESSDNSYQYAYVSMTGSVSNSAFTSEDGQTFQFRDLYNEDIMSAKPCGRAKAHGIFMREETVYGPVNTLIVMDPEDFYSDCSGIGNTVAEGQDSAIYSASGVAVGTDADALTPGLYIRDGKKFIIR